MDTEAEFIQASPGLVEAPPVKCLLIIEDNAADSRRLERLLDKVMKDYPRVVVRSLRQATESIHANEPLMIITDLNLPDSDGMETVDRLLAQCPTVPVVVMTSRGFDSVGLAAVEAGAEDFLTKGTFDALDLARVLLMAIGRHRTHLETIRQAHRDGLTGLANRRYFERTLSGALARAVRLSEECAVGFIDIDGFKAINDKYGHVVGDEILCQLADRIRSSMRPYDSAARLGGDEFAVLLTSIANGHALAAVISRLRDALDRPYQLAGGTLTVHSKASIGIALSGVGSATLAGDELLHNADRAMYVAKSRQAGFIFFDSHFQQHADLGHANVENELAVALSSPELVVHYQPIVSLVDGAFVGVEALARWHHPVRGVLSASEFIGIADSGRFVGRIDRRVLTRAVPQFRAWLASQPGLGQVRLDINTSVANWRDERWLPFVQHTCLQSGLALTNLCFSVSEADLEHFDDGMLLRLDGARRSGIFIAIDHFGVSDMSLRLLDRITFDVIKVDQSLIHSANEKLLDTLKLLADHYGAMVIGMGVETKEHSELLSSHGFQHAQGYLLAEPANSDVTNARIKGWNQGFGPLAYC